MNFGFSEMLFLFLLALLLFGPKKLPEIGRQIGRGLAEFKRASNELKGQLENEMRLLEAEEREKKISPPPPPPENTITASAETAPAVLDAAAAASSASASAADPASAADRASAVTHPGVEGA